MSELTWPEVLDAVSAALSGEPDGRKRLLACWARASAADAPQRCVLAHYLADTEGEVAAEVAWDEAALAAHATVSDDDLAPIGMTSARALLPSLHLNLADGYRRQGRGDAARDHLKQAQATVDELGEDGYGQLIRSGIARLECRLTPGDPTGAPVDQGMT